MLTLLTKLLREPVLFITVAVAALQAIEEAVDGPVAFAMSVATVGLIASLRFFVTPAQMDVIDTQDRGSTILNIAAGVFIGVVLAYLAIKLL